jgi:type IV pilus secretin PilQ/predicted competence protein
MGDALKRNRMLRTGREALAFVAIAALIVSGCASAGPTGSVIPAAQPTAAAAQASAPTVAEISRLDVFAAAPGARIDIAGSGALVWTTYRDAEGNLVVELSNARPGAGVVNRLYSEGMVSSVRVASAGVPSRPVTRFTIATREASEHRLDARGSTLRIDLVPSGREFPTLVAQAPARPAPAPVAAPSPQPAPVIASAPEPTPVIAPAPEPAPAAPVAIAEAAPQVAAAPVPAPVLEPLATAETRPVAAPHGGQVPAGTADDPYVAPPPSGSVATQLRRIELVGAGVRIDGDGEFAYSTFRLENPERFVIDLDGVVNRSDRGTLPVGEGALSRIRVSQFKAQPTPVSRVVFDLTEPSIPTIERTARGLLVSFGEQELAVHATPPPPAAELRVPANVEHEPQWAAAPVEPATPRAEAQPIAEEEWASAEDLEMATAPSAPAPPASDVEAFRSPRIETYPPGAALGAAPAPEPPPTVSAFEAQDVQPAATATPGVPRITPAVVAGQTVVAGRKEYSGEPISMSLQDADVREVLRTFARISGLNIVIQPGVRGTVTVELERVPWDQALDQILKINNLGYELEANIMRIAPLETLEREARRAQTLQAAQALSIPLRTVVKRLSYSRAQEIAALLQRGGGGVMSQRGSVIVDRRTNTIILKELPTYIDTVLAVIETLDTPEPQVAIEARVVETTKQFSRTLGINWGFTGAADQAHGNPTGLQFPYNVNTSGGVSLLTGGANGFINLALGNVLDTFTLNARLQAAEAEGLINVISAPKVVTLNNNAASIQSGVQIPVQTTANNTTSVQFVNATLRLNVTPHVTAEGTVMLDIDVQKREPLFAFQVAGSPSAPIATKEARTRVIVRDGGTTVIGGIYKVSTDQGQDRVPGLSSVPLLGNLFKNRRSRSDNDELLIFISPRVIKL